MVKKWNVRWKFCVFRLEAKVFCRRCLRRLFLFWALHEEHRILKRQIKLNRGFLFSGYNFLSSWIFWDMPKGRFKRYESKRDYYNVSIHEIQSSEGFITTQQILFLNLFLFLSRFLKRFFGRRTKRRKSFSFFSPFWRSATWIQTNDIII